MVIGAVIAALAVAGIIGAVVLVNSDDTPDDAAAQIGWMQDGCQQWADGYQGASGPDDDWCNSMAGWMNGRTGDDSMMDRRQMMGPMMWQSADNMRATCEQWMAEHTQRCAHGRRHVGMVRADDGLDGPEHGRLGQLDDERSTMTTPRRFHLAA